VALMREHPRIGAGILSASEAPVLQLAAEISMAHHEHYSGAGYPWAWARRFPWPGGSWAGRFLRHAVDRPLLPQGVPDDQAWR
jgi:hypothetical protein